MKRFYPLLILLLIAPFCLASQGDQPGPEVAGYASSCTTSNDTDLVANTNTSGSNVNIKNYYTAAPFTLGSSSTITRYYINVYSAAGATFTCSIYNDNAGVPGSEISGTPTSATVSTGWTYKEIDLATPKSGLSGQLYLVCYGASTDTTWEMGTTGANAHFTGATPPPVTGGTGQMHFEIKGCTP
jgi:hypothetical protein